MKKLTTLLMLVPSIALAHGGHAEMPAAAHDTFHFGPWVAVGLLLAALLVFHIRRQ